MAFAGHTNNHALGADEYGSEKYGVDGGKYTTEHIDDAGNANAAKLTRSRDAPPLVRDLSPEDRERLEANLRRKIDFRLLPMIILIYLMNYLDRNNIAAARLAGLEKELKLTSVQYSVSFPSTALDMERAGSSYFILPDFPRTTKWLTEEERQLAVWRLEEDIGEDDWVGSKQQTFLHGAKLAFTDIKMWILMLMLFCIVASGSVTNFFPTVVATLGYSNIISLLLTAPPYILAVITALTNAWHADRTGERYFHITLPLYFAVVAFILAATTTSTAPRYVAMMLMVPGVYTGYVVALAWISNTLPRPPAKRAAALAAINAVSNTSSIYASYMYPESDGPRYVMAMGVNCATAVIAILSATTLRFILVRLNKKLDRGEVVEGAINVGEGVPGEASKHGFRFRV
ncbi:MAG: hypothetical protein M1827_006076 [Pycnora praestabilis]|nr:MAG: hypothetical protein M1827_006076 [Pycnora praestabilis]